MTLPGTRILLFTGKGGVGKTTVAAATALRCADAGARTIVVSTDPAHSLADALGVELGDRPTKVARRLWGQQLDTRARFEQAWSDVRSYLVEFLDWAGADAIEAEELAVVPGLDEVFALADLKELAAGDAYDVVVVDCAPTAETLRLLSLPDVLGWYMERVFDPQRRMSRVARPVMARLTSMPMVGDRVFGAVESFYQRIEGVGDLLRDGATTTARLVVNPERLVVAEARRTYSYLALFGYAVDAVVVNRVLPDDVDTPWFDRWRTTQAAHLGTIHDVFAPLPVLRAPLAPDELVGVDALRRLGDQVYGDLDPAARLSEGDAMRVEHEGASVRLSLHLPCVDKDEIHLGRGEDELFLAVGPHRRSLVLPDSLARREVVGAHMEHDRLVVEFAS